MSSVLRIGHAYEQAAGWYTQSPPIRSAALPPPAVPSDVEPSAVDAQWVLDFARLTGLDFVTETDAEPVAVSIGQVKALLAVARGHLEAGVEPPVRPAPA